MHEHKGGTGWANSFPDVSGSLYSQENEKDSCGVGFICSVKSASSHKIVSNARGILCNMTHRGAVGADKRDGDGAGVLTGLPHAFLKAAVSQHKPQVAQEFLVPGKYATGNLFFNPAPDALADQLEIFEMIAATYGLKVVHWRPVPVDDSTIGPAAKEKQPSIYQPFIVLENADESDFELRIFFLRKHASHSIELKPWFYLCSLSTKTIVYKGGFCNHVLGVSLIY